MKTTTPTKSPLTELVQSGQEAIHNLGDHVRTTADKSRQLMNRRHRNELLRDLGQLHYDAHLSGDEPNRESINRIIALLDTDPGNDEE